MPCISNGGCIGTVHSDYKGHTEWRQEEVRLCEWVSVACCLVDRVGGWVRKLCGRDRLMNPKIAYRKLVLATR